MGEVASVRWVQEGRHEVGASEIQKVGRAGASLVKVKEGKPRFPFCAAGRLGHTQQSQRAPPTWGRRMGVAGSGGGL